MELSGLIFFKYLEIKKIKIGFKLKIFKFDSLFRTGFFFYYKYASSKFVSKTMA